jgi:hypothetical protein
LPFADQAVSKRVRRSRVVSEVMVNNRWIMDISGSLSLLALRQYINLLVRLQSVQLDDQAEDKFIWKWSANQQYSRHPLTMPSS